MGEDAKGELLTPEEVAALKGVSRQTVYTALRRGTLAGVTVLNRRAIRRQDAQAWEPLRDAAARGRRGGRPKTRPEVIPDSAH